MFTFEIIESEFIPEEACNCIMQAPNNEEDTIPFPDEITTEIFLRLPAKSIARFRCVSKSWNSILTSTDFIRSHLHRSSTPRSRRLLLNYIQADVSLLGWYPPGIHYITHLQGIDLTLHDIKLIDTHNGIICLSTFDARNPRISIIYLWNPFIKQQTRLPEPNYGDSSLIAFGFNPLSGRLNDFKVLSIGSHFQSRSGIEIYSLTTNSWKKIDCSLPSGISKFIFRQVIIGEFIYWSTHFDDQDHTVKSLLRFNVVLEEFHEIPLPDSSPSSWGYLTRSEENLSLLLWNKCNELQVWVMEENESWMRRYEIELPAQVPATYSPLGFTTDRHFLFVVNHYLRRNQPHTALALYDARSMKFERAFKLDCLITSGRLLIHVESLISVLPSI